MALALRCAEWLLGGMAPFFWQTQLAMPPFSYGLAQRRRRCIPDRLPAGSSLWSRRKTSGSGHLLTAESSDPAAYLFHTALGSLKAAPVWEAKIVEPTRSLVDSRASVWATFSTVLPPLTAGRRGMAHSRAEVVLDREGDLCRELRSQSAEGVGDPDAAPQE